jgi:L-amino acid N-acyltransferase YncA
VVLGKLLRRAWSTRASVSLVREPLVEVPIPAGSRIEFVPPEAFEDLAQLLKSSTGLDYLFVRNAERTRLAGVGTVFVARDETGLLMAFYFVYETDDRVALDQVARNMHPDLAADEVLTELVYCLPAFRGRGVMRQLLHATGAALAARGKRRAFAYVDTTNNRSLRMFARAGYAPTGVERVDHYRFGRHRTTFRPTSVTSEERWAAAVIGSGRQIRGEV